MRVAFKDINFRAERTAMVDLCNEIIEGYLAQGLRMTLRQLYYQLVTRNAIPNQERAYKNIGKLLSDARLGGLVDWDAIEDRVRVPRLPVEFDNLRTLVDAALRAYRLPRWEGQEDYVELWVEKDAISGVLAPLAAEYHITLMVNRGYSSQSAMYEAASRFIRKVDEMGIHDASLLYLGDHDPSGEDMARDIQDRLDMFGADVCVEKIALTMDQVRQYNPPPNPAKHTDSRHSAYVAQYGDDSWEVDALPPDVLQSIVRSNLEGYCDWDKMATVVAKENADKNTLRGFVKGL